jgi:hypothetical protein
LTNLKKKFTKDASQTVKSPTKAVDSEAFYEVLGAEKPSLDRQGQAVELPKDTAQKQNVSANAKPQSAFDKLGKGAKKTLNDVTKGLSKAMTRTKAEQAEGQEATPNAPNKNNGRQSRRGSSIEI